MDVYEIYIVFFFENEDMVKEFLLTKNPDLCITRKLFRGNASGVNGTDIIADSGIYAPLLVVYSLGSIEPYVFRIGNESKESAS